MNLRDLPDEQHLVLYGPPLPPRMAARRLCDANIKGEYEAEGLHPYTDTAGDIIYWRIRARLVNSEKWIRPMRVRGMVYDLKEPEFIDGKKPLYRLRELAKAKNSGQPVWFVEGEKCVDSLAKLGILATTAGGAQSDDKADVSPLRGWRIILWPDNNLVGREHMRRVAEKLRALDCTVEIVDIEALALPEGGDVVDWLAAHPNATAVDLMALAKLSSSRVSVDDQAANSENTKSDAAPLLEDAKAEIERLSKLGQLEYETTRTDAAKALGIRASVLDRMVRELRAVADDDDLFKDVTPSDHAVPLADILDLARKLFADHVVASPHAAVAVALWAAWTWAFEHSECAPILLCKSPVKRCGKTTTLSVIANMARRPMAVSNITAAALFRSIEKFSPTLVLDEADTFLPENDDLRGLINAGHTRPTAHVVRTVGENFDPQIFKIFGPKVLALIGRAPDTVEDRSVIISLQRKFPGEKVKKLRDTPNQVWKDLQAYFARWTSDHGYQLRRARPEIPRCLNDRAADSWAPLLALAEIAGGKWPELARHAAVALSGEGEPDIDTVLLTNIRLILDTVQSDPITSLELVAELIKDKDQPWATFNKGREISQSQLSRRLSKFSIVSRSVRKGNETPKGWPRKAFDDAFARYLPSTGLESATPPQASNGDDCGSSPNRHSDQLLHFAEPPQANTDAAGGGVALLSPLGDASNEMSDNQETF